MDLDAQCNRKFAAIDHPFPPGFQRTPALMKNSCFNDKLYHQSGLIVRFGFRALMDKKTELTLTFLKAASQLRGNGTVASQGEGNMSDGK